MTSGRTDVFDRNSTAHSIGRAPWKRGIHHVKFVVVVLCATSTVCAGSERVYEWLFPSELDGAASQHTLAGRAMFGAVLMVAGMAALAYAVKSEMELNGRGRGDKSRTS